MDKTIFSNIWFYITAVLISLVVFFSGKTDVQNYLGDYFMSDESFAGSYNENIAMYWYRRSAENGSAYGQYRYGVSDLVLVLTCEGYPWVEKSAAQGFGAAQFFLAARHYKEGFCVEKDSVVAVDWLNKAASQGHVKAQYELGKMYQEGNGVVKDYVFAKKWYEKSAENGDRDAIDALGLMYAEGLGVPVDFSKAMSFFSTAASGRGHRLAEKNLGDMYFNGLGVDKNYQLAFDWYKKSADKYEAGAQTQLAFMYENGIHVAKDIKKAVDLYREANSSTEAQFRLGVICSSNQGIGCRSDENESLISKSARAGNENAMLWVADEAYKNVFKEHFGCDFDAPTAIKFYMVIGAKGVPRVLNNIGEIIEKCGPSLIDIKNLDSAMRRSFYWFLQAAESKYEKSYFHVADAYESGKNVSPNFEKAFFWYSKSAEAGNDTAQYKLGLMYEAGKGVEPNNRSAFDWFLTSAMNGNVLAMSRLAELYSGGSYLKADLIKAYAWYSASAYFGGGAETKRDGILLKINSREIGVAQNVASKLIEDINKIKKNAEIPNAADQVITNGVSTAAATALNNQNNSSSDSAWESVSSSGCCTYKIPPTMELQSGKYREMMDAVQKASLGASDANRIVAQSKGINELDPVSLKKYSRIIVNTNLGAKGEYPKLGGPLKITSGELEEWDEMTGGLLSSMTASPPAGAGINVISRQPTKVVSINGVDMILAIHRRTVNDGPPALVKIYFVPNNDRIHTVSISYRESESGLWKDDLEKVIETFNFEKM